MDVNFLEIKTMSNHSQPLCFLIFSPLREFGERQCEGGSSGRQHGACAGFVLGRPEFKSSATLVNSWNWLPPASWGF